MATPASADAREMVGIAAAVARGEAGERTGFIRKGGQRGEARGRRVAVGTAAAARVRGRPLQKLAAPGFGSMALRHQREQSRWSTSVRARPRSDRARPRRRRIPRDALVARRQHGFVPGEQRVGHHSSQASRRADRTPSRRVRKPGTTPHSTPLAEDGRAQGMDGRDLRALDGLEGGARALPHLVGRAGIESRLLQALAEAQLHGGGGVLGEGHGRDLVEAHRARRSSASMRSMSSSLCRCRPGLVTRSCRGRGAPARGHFVQGTTRVALIRRPAAAGRVAPRVADL